MEELAKSQDEDCDIGPIKQLLTEDSNRPPWDRVAGLSAAGKSLWRQWERLRVFRGVLMRRFEEPDGRLSCLQIILPSTRREDFVKMVHEGTNGGHLGRRRTKYQVQRRAYWPGWNDTVVSVLRKCEPCATYHRGKAPKQTPLKPFVAGEPWEVVSIDITGPHPRSRRGHEYILTVVDHFTKWAEAIPIRNHTATTVARVLFDNIFSRLGMPLRCLSDQGAEFESALFQQLCAWMGIEKIRTTPYHPSTNATVERFHRTLNSMLAKVVGVNHRDWCEHLPSVMAAYRASLHESTQFTPNRLMFGRENRMPVDLVLGGLTSEEPRTQSMEDFAEEIVRRQQADFQLVREHLREAASRRKEQYDSRVRASQFVPGQLVYYFYPRRRQGLSPKWQRLYTGPYHVIRLIDDHTVVIQKNKRSKFLVVHRDKLKACFNGEGTGEDTSSHAKPGRVNTPHQQPNDPEDSVDSEVDQRSTRAKRCARKPRYLEDFVLQ